MDPDGDRAALVLSFSTAPGNGRRGSPSGAENLMNAPAVRAVEIESLRRAGAQFVIICDLQGAPPRPLR